MSGEFSRTLDIIDELVTRGPGECDLEHDVLPVLQEPSARDYFFDRLDDPGWIGAIVEAGLLKQVPPVQEYEQGGLSFPRWHVSEFLARMAKDAPESVVRAISKIPDTDNPQVHRDLIRALQRLPVDYAVEHIPQVIHWIQVAPKVFFAEEVADLAEKVGGFREHHGQALDLLGELLRVLPPEEADEETISLGPRLRTRIDSWHYEKILRNYVLADFVQVYPDRVVELLSSGLEDALKYTSDSPPADHSYIWCPAVTQRLKSTDGVRSQLVAAVREAAEAWVQDATEKVSEVVDRFESRDWFVFQRLAFHILRVQPEYASGLIEDRLTERRFFETVDVRNEYVDLLEARFGELSPSGQEKILGWIEEGPDVDAHREFAKDVTGEVPSPKELSDYSAVWRRDRLAFLDGQLPDEWQERLDELSETFGPPEDVSQPFRTSGVWAGPTSPKEKVELERMAVPELVDYLRDWEPSEELKAPSREGLARALRSAAEDQAERFASQAELFEGLSAKYLEALMDGFREAVKSGESGGFEDRSNWERVLDLCSWIVDRPRSEGGEWDARSDWGSPRIAVCRLLEASLEDAGSFPSDCSDRALSILQTIANDPEPTVEYEDRIEVQAKDAYQIAINSVRSKALETIIRFGLWAHRRMQKDSQEVDFDRVAAEVLNELERHLDVEFERSVAVRSVYGRWYPWLLLIDQAWIVEHTPQIFPLSDPWREFRDAAWNTYLVFCRPYDAALEPLREQYELAIRELDGSEATRAEDGALHESNKKLASHLMSYYWRGKLDLSDGGMIDLFVTRANVELRIQAMEFVGRSLNNTKEEIPEDIRERLRQLWEWRTESADDERWSTDRQRELGSFVSWFISGRLDEIWALNQLVNVLERGARFEWSSHTVAERLTALASEHPAAVARAIRGLVENSKERWEISVWTDTANELLEELATVENDEVRQIAYQTADELVRKGFMEFRSLASGAS